MTEHKIILHIKYPSIVEAYASQYDTAFRTALDLFYNSELYHEVREGISDMHCRSDGYLAEELSRELELKG
ncbi:hypothetical protein FACS1894190_00910 [Spirochaetia bacterium]|nr:hypothetical protein FACS1894190_00910 [Spirochaetia bacterium]